MSTGNIPKLMKINPWINWRFAEGSGPNERTVRTWINEGAIPGKKIGGAYFVCAADEVLSTGDAMADAFLKDLGGRA